MKTTKLILTALAAVGLMASSASASFEETFDSYEVGTLVREAAPAVWSSNATESDDESKIASDGADGKLLELNTQGEILSAKVDEPFDGNYFSGTVKFVPHSSLVAIDDSDAKVAVYAYQEDDGEPIYLNVYHKVYEDTEYELVTTQIPGLLTAENIDEAHALKISMKFFDGAYGGVPKPYAFQLWFDNVLVTNAAAYTDELIATRDYENGPDPDNEGTWFLSACENASKANSLSAICLKGTGLIDNLKIDESAQVVNVAQVGDNEYDSFAQALLAAKDAGGAPITILSECTYAFQKGDSFKVIDEGHLLTVTGIFAIDENGVYGDPVASVNTNPVTYFASLPAAYDAAANGATITLLDDVTLSTPLFVKKTVTLDIGDFSVTPATPFTKNATYGVGKALIVVLYGGNLTIKGNDGSIAADSSAFNTAIQLTAGNDPRGEDEYAELTVNGGNISGYYYAISGNGTRYGTKVTITDGTFAGKCADTEAGNLAIFNPQGDSFLTITGGTFTGYSSAVEIRGGELDITGGTFTATAEKYEVGPNGSGNTTVGAAIAVSQHTTGKDIAVSIADAELNGFYAVSVANPQGKTTTNVAVTLGDATYNGDLVFSADGNATVTNDGSSLDAPEGYAWVEGTLTKEYIYTLYFVMNGHGTAIDPIKYSTIKSWQDDLPSTPSEAGWTFTGWFTDDGTFEVGYTLGDALTDDTTVYGCWEEKVQYVAQIGDNKYETLAAAIAAVKTGETITLLSNLTSPGISVASGKDFTLDFDGKTVTFECPGAGSAGTKTQGFQLLEGSTIVFKDGTICCSAANKTAEWNKDSAVKGIAMLIQNYADLTLENMVIDGANIAHNGVATRYVMSNNSGSVVIDGTTITAAEGDYAFDTCQFGTYALPTVTVKGESAITGKVELGGGNLDLVAGTLDGEITVDPTKSLATVTKADGFVVTAPAGYEWENGQLVLDTNIAIANDVKYKTLQAAYNAIPLNNVDPVTITLLKNAEGAGIFVTKDQGKKVVFDLDGNTYTCVGPAVGSTGTENQVFHLENGNTVTIKNGTVNVAESAAAGIRFVVQNYCDLTLDGVTLDGTNLGHFKARYAVSNNSGNVVIQNDTVIIASNGANDMALDSCQYDEIGTYTIPTVTINGATITGNVELSGGSLALVDGKLNGEIVVDAAGLKNGVVTKDEGFEVNTPAGYDWVEGTLTKEDIYILTFDMKGHGTAIASVEYSTTKGWGEVTLPPTAPTEAGYKFNGWLDGEGNAFDFTAALTANATAYASWDLDQKFSGGTGTEADPYLIKTQADLQELRTDVNAGEHYADKFFLQKNDIDMAGQEWSGMGTAGATAGSAALTFSGTYDGGNFAIKNLSPKIPNDTYCGGLFNTAKNATIANLTLEFAGFAAGSGGTKKFAGFLGTGYDVTFTNCTFKGDITANHNVGGFVCMGQYGDATTTTGSKIYFYDCVNEGNITCTDKKKAGGFYGAPTNQEAEFVRCVNKGTVKCAGADVGAFIGFAYDVGQATSCPATYVDCTNEGQIFNGTTPVGQIKSPIKSITGTTKVRADQKSTNYGEFDGLNFGVLPATEAGIITLVKNAGVVLGGNYKVMTGIASLPVAFTEADQTISFDLALNGAFRAEVTATGVEVETNLVDGVSVTYTAKAVQQGWKSEDGVDIPDAIVAWAKGSESRFAEYTYDDIEKAYLLNLDFSKIEEVEGAYTFTVTDITVGEQVKVTATLDRGDYGLGAINGKLVLKGKAELADAWGEVDGQVISENAFLEDSTEEFTFDVGDEKFFQADILPIEE